MTMADPAAETSQRTGPLWPVQAVVAFFILLRVYVDFAMPPIGDEAYYWMWGQKLALSYFDHPPLHAWLLRAMDLLFGWNLLSLRALTWLTLGGTLAIFWSWARRLAPANPEDWFWRAAAIYLASPLFFAMTSISFHDHLLIFLCLAAAHFLLLFAERWETTGRGYRDLYAGAALLGLAVLTKYNGVLVALGMALFFVARRPLRVLFKGPHLYLAALLSIAIQLPVLIWNLTEGFASYRFHLSERWEGGGFHFQPLALVYYLVLTIVVVSPLLVAPIGGYLLRPPAPGFAARAKTLASSVFVVSSLTMIAMSLFVEVFFYWNIVAFLLLMPLIVGSVGRRWQLWTHLAYGVVVAAVLAFNGTVVPIGDLINRYDWTISSTFGWDQTAAEVVRLRAEHQASFVVVTRYTTAAQLGFAMHDPEVTAISTRHDEYDFWFDPAAHQGQNAILVGDADFGVGEAAARFRQVTLLETLPIVRFGVTVYVPQIYLAEDYQPPPSGAP